MSTHAMHLVYAHLTLPCLPLNMCLQAFTSGFGALEKIEYASSVEDRKPNTMLGLHRKTVLNLSSGRRPGRFRTMRLCI